MTRPPSNAQDRIQASKPASRSGTPAHEPTVPAHWPRLDELDQKQGQGLLPVLWRLLKVDLAAAAGALFGVVCGVLLGGALVAGIEGLVYGGIAGSVGCALLFTVLAWKDPS